MRKSTKRILGASMLSSLGLAIFLLLALLIGFVDTLQVLALFLVTVAWTKTGLRLLEEGRKGL